MKKELYFLAMALLLVLPVTLFAGSKDSNSRNQIPETPIEAPMDTVFDTCGPPQNPPPFADLTPMGPYKIFDDFYYIGTKRVEGHCLPICPNSHVAIRLELS